MSERRRGLGRGLGALIPSATAPETPDSDAGAANELAPDAGRDAGSAADVSRETPDRTGDPAERVEGAGREPEADTTGPEDTDAAGPGEAEADRTEVDGPGPDGTKADSPGSVADQQLRRPATSRSVPATARQKAMRARMDMGEALRNTTLVSRPSDMFFLPSSTSEATEPEQSASGIEGRSVESAERTDVPRETSGGTSGSPSRSREEAPDTGSAEIDGGQASDGTSGAERADASDDVSRETAASTAALHDVPGARFAEISVAAIHPNRKQPRQVFDEEELAELAYSIGELGVLQPIVVRTSREDGEPAYELVMGERRWRAAQRAGLAAIPAIVRETADDDLLRDALLENLHRSQLNPLEEAAAYQQLLEEFGTTQEELSRKIGRSRPQISNTIRLLRLPPLVQRRVAAGVLSSGHARALLSLSDPAEMERLAQRVVAEGMSVRATEEAAALADGQQRRPKRAPAARGRHQERLDDIAGAFADRLDTSVKIALGSRKGKMTIEFASVEDLHRIVGVLGVGMDGS